MKTTVMDASDASRSKDWLTNSGINLRRRLSVCTGSTRNPDFDFLGYTIRAVVQVSEGCVQSLYGPASVQAVPWEWGRKHLFSRGHQRGDNVTALDEIR